MDAGAFGCRLGPKEAYRFAKGQEVVAYASLGESNMLCCVKKAACALVLAVPAYILIAHFATAQPGPWQYPPLGGGGPGWGPGARGPYGPGWPAGPYEGYQASPAWMNRPRSPQQTVNALIAGFNSPNSRVRGEAAAALGALGPAAAAGVPVLVQALGDVSPTSVWRRPPRSSPSARKQSPP
jgi:hypothetical protein